MTILNKHFAPLFLIDDAIILLLNLRDSFIYLGIFTF